MKTYKIYKFQSIKITTYNKKRKHSIKAFFPVSGPECLSFPYTEMIKTNSYIYERRYDYQNRNYKYPVIIIYF